MTQITMARGVKHLASPEETQPTPPPRPPLRHRLAFSQRFNDTIEFTGPRGTLEVQLMRTLRVSDNDGISNLPPSFGTFALHAVRNYPEAFPSKVGYFAPMYRELQAM